MKIVFYILSLIFIFFFSGCDNKEEYKIESQDFNKHIYIFGIHPYLNSQHMYNVYEPIMRYLEKKVPNAKFFLETSNDYAHYEQKLYVGHFDFALPNPYQTIKSLKIGYNVVAKMYPDEVFRGIIVSRIDNKIDNFEQLKGKKVSFPAKTDLAASMMPLMFLHENGINVNKDITKNFVGSQYSSIMNAYTKDSIVAATWPPPWHGWCMENPEKAKEMKVVWQTDHLVNNSVIVKSGVEESISISVANVLANMRFDEEGIKLLKNAGFEGFELATNQNYDKVKIFLDKYEKLFGLPEHEN
ncbi:MAG: phosphate/phosphite/phosphonate ABC transporter substrate-binding protein [Campylobacterales bacterium]|nr:phosphate/phosphite/phosphonate ABC transporter substrate-binding protein [Campylobacterales bacterium]